MSETSPKPVTILNIVNNYNKRGWADFKNILVRKKHVPADDLIISIKNRFLGDFNLSLRQALNLVPESASTIQKVPRKGLNIKPLKV